MRLKKLGAALFVVAALSAVLASSALAAATTTDVKWFIHEPEKEEKELPKAEEIETVQVGEASFATTVSGKKVKLKSTGISCVECKIENSGGTAVGSGKLKFTGVTVVEPAGCTVAETLTTKALSVQADWMIGTANYIKFVPSAGEEAGFITVELGGGESCPISTPITPKGSVFAQSANVTGVLAAEQRASSSESINSTAGGTLHVGTEKAVLTATVGFTLKLGSMKVPFGTH